MKTMAVVFGMTLALAPWHARAAESEVAETFDAGPAIQGNSDPAIVPHRKKATTSGMHRKAM